MSETVDDRERGLGYLGPALLGDAPSKLETGARVVRTKDYQERLRKA
ncbi:MAG TPA: hypothetical protein VLQ67_03180 [Arachnia sp.]|nr:hypothetical protein [Arachnia sp.]